MDIPKSLKTYILFEFLQKKSIKEVCISVIRVTGINAIQLKKSAEILEKTNEKLDAEDMKYCIHYEFLHKKPIGQAYKSICAVFGKDSISFNDFKEKFGNGEFEEKIGKSLGEMPADIQAKAAKKSNTTDGWSLGDVSPTFRDVINQKEVYCDKMDIQFTDRFTNFQIGTEPMIEYDHIRGSGYCRVKRNGKEKVIKKYHLEVFFDDLETFFKNPNFQLGTLKITILLGVKFSYENAYFNHLETPEVRMEQIKQSFAKFRSQLHVTSFDIQFEIHSRDLEGTEPIMSFLPFLKPGILQKIRIKMDFEFEEMMKKVVILPQWRMAKELKLGRLTKFVLPFYDLLHFEKFEVFIPNLSEKQVIEIKEALFKRPSFDSCVLECYDDEIDPYYIFDRLGPYEIIDGECLFKSQFTGAVYQIRVSDDKVCITKK